MLHFFNELLAESFRHQGHPEDVWAGLLKVLLGCGLVGEVVIAWVNVTFLPILERNQKSYQDLHLFCCGAFPVRVSLIGNLTYKAA